MDYLFIGNLGIGELIIGGAILVVGPLLLVLLICGAFTTFPPDPQTTDRSEWDPKAHQIFYGVIFYSLANILGTIVSILDKWSSLLYYRNQFISASSPEDIINILMGDTPSFFSGTTVANFFVVIGLILYFMGLEEFMKIHKDFVTVNKLRDVHTATVFGIVAVILGYIPVAGPFFSWVFNLVMYFMFVFAFGYLRYSPVFNIKARAGAGLLRTAAIMYILSMFIPFIGGLFSLFGFLMTLIGWGRIANGGPVAFLHTATSQPSNYSLSAATPAKETHVTQTPAEVSRGTVYCSHCGTQCKESQRYCSRCGFELPSYKKQEEPVPSFIRESLPQAVAEPKPEVKPAPAPEPAPKPIPEPVSLPAPKPVFEPTPKPAPVPAPKPVQKVAETTSSTSPVKAKNNTNTIYGIAAAVVVIAVIILSYTFWYKPYAIERDAPRYYTFTNLNLRTSQDSESKTNILTMLPYGTEVIAYEKDFLWARVKANGAKGFVSSRHLISKIQFALLDGVWGNEDAKKCLGATRYRLAVLDYLQRKGYSSGNRGWQIYANPYGSRLNTVVYPKMCLPENDFEDLVFIITDNLTRERRLVVYRFENETEEPVFEKDVIIRGDLKIRKITGEREPFSSVIAVTVSFGNGNNAYFDIDLK